MQTDPTLQFIESALREAGAAVMRHFGDVRDVRLKNGNPHDVVTAADLEASALLVERIRAAYPEDAIVSEEDQSAAAGAGEGVAVWFIDPIDGTKNFQHRTPLFGVMIARTLAGEPTAAGIYLPCTDEMFLAAKGAGAWRNGERIGVSSQADFGASFGLGSVSAGTERTLATFAAIGAHAPERAPWVSVLASAAVAMAYVADGRRDWFISSSGYDWDYAPGALIIGEAGGMATDNEGKPWRVGAKPMVSSNGALHADVMAVVQSISK